jgi:hypothetical protein
VLVAAPQRGDDDWIELDRRAVVAVVVGVVVALLVARAHAVGHRRVEHRLLALDTAHEASPAHEDQDVAGSALGHRTLAGRMPAGHRGDRDPVPLDDGAA